MKWLQNFFTFQKAINSEVTQAGFPLFERFDGKLTPNIRALRLTLDIADYLISMNVDANTVIGLSLNITDTYCTKAVQVDISSSLMTISQDRGDESEPLTLMRHAKPRAINNMLVQELQELVSSISDGEYSLGQAEEAFDQIIKNPAEYPLWLRTIGSALISSGVGALFTGSFAVIVTTFIAGAIVSYSLFHFSRRHVPAFFSQVFAAGLITILAGIAYWLSITGTIPFFSTIQPSMIVIGGIIMLVAGLAIVSAVQDAIDEFYVTATARLLRVILMTIGIVIGVLSGLYLLQQLDQPLYLNTEYPVLEAISWQYVGAFAIAAGYALSMQTKWTGIIISGLMGMLGWYVYVFSTLSFELQVLAASGIAATAVGVATSLLARFWRMPSGALITAGIIPLVPGLMLFNGLLELMQDSPTVTNLAEGMLTLLTAAGVAIAIAAGATLGNMIARPIRRTLTRTRNVLPSHARSRKEQKAARKAAHLTLSTNQEVQDDL